MAQLTPGDNVLTKAQVLALLASTSNAAVSSGLGITLQWNRDAGNLGIVDRLNLGFTIIPQPVPVFISSPTVVGVGNVGEILSCTSDGTWTNNPTGYTYRWCRNGIAIPGATATTYTVITEDLDSVITCAVTAHNTYGFSVEEASNGIMVEAIVVPTLYPWLNTAFRATTNGSATWAGGVISDPQDDDNYTSTIVAGLPLYPAPVKPGAELDHGRTGTGVSGAFLDATALLAANEPLLGGTHSWSSAAGYGYSRELPPGNYLFRAALGQAAGAGRREVLIVMDGLSDGLTVTLGTPPTSLGIWSPSTAYIASKMIVGVDLGIWKCTTAGTTGTVKPTGVGPTYTDGTTVWTRVTKDSVLINALWVIDGTTTGSANLVDQNSNRVDLANWKSSPPVPLTVSGTYGNGYTVIKADGYTVYVRNIGMKSTGDPLSDITLTDDVGVAEDSTPIIYARQPENYKALRLIAQSGGQSPSNYSLSGTLAPYFKLASYKGRTYLTHNATLIPDSLAGTGKTLVVTQNSAGLSHATTLNCEVVSSRSKPASGLLSKITTPNWLNRQKIRDVFAVDLWAGYTDQPFASDQLCTDGADFMAKFSALVPDGTSWYRLRIGNNRYDGEFGPTQTKDFGTGGVLIEPAAGVTKEQARWNIFGVYRVAGMHIRNLHIVADKTNLTAYMIRFYDEGPTGINGGGNWNTCKINNCNVGPLFITGNTPENSLDKGAYFLSMLHGKSVEVSDCDVWGTNTCYGFTGVRAMKFSGNSYRCIPADIHGLSNCANPESTQNVFADNDVYCDISNCSAWAEPDWAGYVSKAHADWIQIRTFNQNMTDWHPNAGPDGNIDPLAVTKGWKVGQKCLSMDSVPSSIYEVVAVNGPDPAWTGSTPPMGTGSTIVDGNVTWKHVWTYSTASDVYMNVENCSTHSACPLANGPARQWFIDSNGGSGGVAPNFGAHNCGVYLSANGNVVGSLSIYGIQSRSKGVVHAEYNSFVSNSGITPGATLPLAQLRAERGTLRSRYNYVRNASAAMRLAVDNESVVTWTNAAVSPNRPSDLFAGPMTLNANNIYTYPGFDEDLYSTHSTFAAAYRAVTKPTNPAMGPQ